MSQLTFWSGGHPANLSASPDLEEDWMTRVATSCLPILPLLADIAPSGWFGRTSPVSCPQTTDGILAPSLAGWQNSGMGSPSGFLMLSTSEYHSGAAVSSLSGILETGDVPQRYFLSAQACKGILHRAEQRGKTLPPPTARGVDTCGADDNQAQAGYLIAYGGGNSAAIDTATTLTAHGQRLDFDSETFVVNGRQDPVVSGIAQALGCQNNGMDNVLCIKGTAIDRAPQHGGNGLGIAEDGVCPTLTAADRHAVQYADAVRRLTPVECERLQGMPDNHTRIPWRGKNAADCPDGPRYKAIGNSMAVPVMRWIGERIALQSSLAASSLAVGL